jgi:hypothetical protein
VVVGVFGGRPVYLREVAEIVDGAEEPANYVFFGWGAHAGAGRQRRGDEGAARVVPTGRLGRRAGGDLDHGEAAGGERDFGGERGLAKVEELQGPEIPADVEVSDHAALRRDGGGEIERTAAAHGHRGVQRVDVDLADAGLARVGDRGGGDSRRRSR